MCSNDNRNCVPEAPVIGLTDLESSHMSLATISVLKMIKQDILGNSHVSLFLWALFSLNKENEDNQTQSRNGGDTI